MTRKRKPLPILENVTIEAVAAEGKCVAHVKEMAVFVPFVVPGDIVDLQVKRRNTNIAKPRLSDLLNTVHYALSPCATISAFAEVVSGRIFCIRSS